MYRCMYIVRCGILMYQRISTLVIPQSSKKIRRFALHLVLRNQLCQWSGYGPRDPCESAHSAKHT